MVTESGSFFSSTQPQFVALLSTNDGLISFFVLWELLVPFLCFSPGISPFSFLMEIIMSCLLRLLART